MLKQRNYQMLHFHAYESQAGLRLDLQYVIPSPLLISDKDDVWSPFVSQYWTRFRDCLDQTNWCVIFAEVFVDAVVVAPVASFQFHLRCLPPLLAHFLTLYGLAYPVKQK